VRAALKLAAAAAILASTYYAIRAVAEVKSERLAGGGVFVLDRHHAAEMRTFDALLETLRGWDEDGLARALAALQEARRIWVAPNLAGDRSAIYVRSLGLVSRVYIRRSQLLGRTLPFPDLDVPEAAQRTYSTIVLAGTLYHELQHYDGLEDEVATYGREVEWYERLGERVAERLRGERRRWFEWAVASAVESALAARERATGLPPEEP
jgi:hypothetical protein